MTSFHRLLMRNQFVCLGLIVMTLVGCGAISSPSTVPAGKMLYRDPEGYFSITLPKEWIVTHDVQSFGKSGDTYTSRFDAPTRTGSDITWTQVEAFPYVAQSDGQSRCDFMKREQLTTTLDGLPAYKFVGQGVTNWRLFSSSVEFDITLVYPANDASAAQAVNDILLSFDSSNSSPLRCD